MQNARRVEQTPAPVWKSTKVMEGKAKQIN